MRPVKQIIIFALAALVVACGGGGDATAPAAPILLAVTPSSVAGEFGDSVAITVVVKNTNGDVQRGVRVSFAATGGGLLSSTAVVTDAMGRATTQWKLAASISAQRVTATIAGGQPVVFTAIATNPWEVVISGTTAIAARTADPGVLFGAGPNWASTRLGSPPQLLIACSAGTVILAVTHPNLITLDELVTYQIDNSSRVGESWLEVAPEYDIIGHPGPTAVTSALVRRIADARIFNISFRHYSTNELYAPNFDMLGLSLVLPQVMANCPSASAARAVSITELVDLRHAVGS